MVDDADIASLFRASAELGIPTMQLKAAVVAKRIRNHGGELTENIRVSIDEARQWFAAEAYAKVKSETASHGTRGTGNGEQ